MSVEQVSFWKSFVSRFALFFTGLNIITILIVGYLVYQLAAEVITTHSQDRINYTADLASKTFYSLLNEVANDIAVTSKNPILRNFINGPNQSNLEDLNELFSAIIENKGNYFQIRLLDTNDNGKEIVRFDKVNQVVSSTAPEKLQYKGDRRYYQEAVSIPHGTYYYSDINLNEEFGKISTPLIPTLRAIGHVYDNKENTKALLVINVDLTPFYSELNQIMKSEFQLMLLNSSGDYLFAPEMEKCFGKQRNTNDSFSKDFGQNVDDLLNKQVAYDFIRAANSTTFLYQIRALPYPQGQQIYLITLMEDQLLFRNANLVRNRSLRVIAIICFATLLVVYLFTRVFSKGINQITQAVSAYEENASISQNTKLPETRQDEIGLLARSFTRMRKTIDQQVTDLKKSLNSEQKAIKERDEFLQNMSHELRTPLNAILGLTELLYKNNPSPKQYPIIDSLNRSATNLSGLMYDILDYQKLVEGKVKINFSAIDIHALLTDLHGNYQYEAMNKGLTFSLVIDHRLKQDKYLMDPLRLSQIITNLIVNAIKYTNQGELQLAGKIIDGTTSQLEVSVVDTGVGILPKNLKRIKERFYQESDQKQGKGIGYGLGLSIVIQMVELFGGSLEVTSEKDKGSTFTIYLPLVKAAPSLIDSKASPTHNVHLPHLSNSYRILYIEDDSSTQLMVAHVLGQLNVELALAETLDQAKDIIRTRPPHLILSDLMLDNTVISLELKKIVNQTGTPAILLSAFERTNMQQLSPFHLQKPFDLNRLLDMVVVILGQNEYDTPSLEPIFLQYDQDQDKFSRYLSILEDEFHSYLNRFERVYQTGNQNEWQAIMHKLNTHIKSLHLERLSKIIPAKISELEIEQLAEIRNILWYCLCVIRVESHANLVN